MKRYLLILLAVCRISAIIEAENVEWNSQRHTITFFSKGNMKWIDEGRAEFRFNSSEVVSTANSRFNVAFYAQNGRYFISGKDSAKIIDWEMIISTVDSLALRIDLTLFNQSEGPLKLDQIVILEGKLTGSVTPGKNYCLTSGLHSWDGGSIAKLKDGTTTESYYTLALESPALAAGFLTGYHNLDRFTVIPSGKETRFSAYGECNQCLFPAGSSRRCDPLFLSGDGNPLGRMELFADLAARENKVQLWPENFATWCSWYSGWMRQESIYQYKKGLQKGVETNVPLISGILGTRGTPSMRVVDDSNEMPYGDWDNNTLAVSNGFSGLAKQMNALQIKAGIWYPPFWVSTHSRLFQEEPDLLCRNYDGKIAVGTKALIPESMYGNHLAFLDASNPDAEKKLESTARVWRDRGFRYVMTDFMYWGAWPQKRYDSTLTAVETYLRGLKAMRRGFGKDTYWLHCGALLGPAMGLCDGMRISGDSHGDDIDSYNSAASRWFYNWRVWLNDPDAIVCRRYGEAKGIAWSRAWMSWMALAGTALTYGDTFDDLPAEYVGLYKQILPPLQKAGRPLDIWENDPYLLWGLDPGEADGPYTLFGVFEFQGLRVGQDIALNLDEIAARARSWDYTPSGSPSTWLVWDFWEHRLIRNKGPILTIPIPSKSCRIFSLRPMLGRPQLLGTSGHFSQGALETQDIKWNVKAGMLSGKVRGNGGDPTTLFIYVPNGMKITSASVGFDAADAKNIQAEVVALEIPATGEIPVRFEIAFSGTTVDHEVRSFQKGPATEIKSRQTR